MKRSLIIAAGLCHNDRLKSSEKVRTFLIVPMFLMIGLVSVAFPQQIFRTNLEGTAVQGFSSPEAVDGFTVSGPDGNGYVYLVAHAGGESGEIARTKWQGSGFQEFTLPAGSYVTGFKAVADTEYVYLIAVGSDGSSGEIIRTRWLGTAVQAYSVPPGEHIKTIGMSGPDAEGYVYLSVSTVGIEEDPKEEPGQDWLEPAVFSLEAIASPCSDHARISYSVAEPCKVGIRVYDPSGRLITRLVAEEKPVGRYDFVWHLQDSNGRKISAGTYFVKMDAGKFKTTRKVTVLR
jgi:flagellar hook assembly protein FlgD